MSVNPDESGERTDSPVAAVPDPPVEPTAGSAAAGQETVTAGEVQVRRSPRHFRFMLVGAALFALVALSLTFAFPENPAYDRGSVFGFLLVVGVAVGLALGSVVALTFDRATARRARTVQANRIDVHIPGVTEGGADEAGAEEAESASEGSRSGAES